MAAPAGTWSDADKLVGHFYGLAPAYQHLPSSVFRFRCSNITMCTTDRLPTQKACFLFDFRPIYGRKSNFPLLQPTPFHFAMPVNDCTALLIFNRRYSGVKIQYKIYVFTVIIIRKVLCTSFRSEASLEAARKVYLFSLHLVTTEKDLSRLI